MTHKFSRLTVLILISILALGFYLRWESVSRTEVIKPLRADAGQYFMYAYNLRHKHTYSHHGLNTESPDSQVTPDAMRLPGYPLFLSLFVDGLPDGKMLNRILFWQALISTATILLTFLLFQKLLPPIWALGVSLLTALSPHLIVSNSYLLTETLFCFLLVMVGWLMVLFFKRQSLWLVTVIGCTVGIATLVRPSLQFFSIGLVLFLLFHYGWKMGSRYAAVLLIGFAVAFLPWIGRNMVTLGIATDQRLAINFLHHGMYPDFMHDGIPQSYGFPYRYDPKAQETSANMSSVLEAISDRFFQRPFQQVKWYLLDKPRAYYSWNMIQGAGDAFVYPVSSSPYFDNPFFRISHRMIHGLHCSILLLAFLGSLMAWFPYKKTYFSPESLPGIRFCSLLLIYYTAIHMTGAPFPRYSVPLRPFLFGMALFAPWLFLTYYQKRHKNAEASREDSYS